MNRLATLLALILSLSHPAFAAGIADMIWNQSNLETLLTFNKNRSGTIYQSARKERRHSSRNEGK
jgi:hypothetical protein